MSYVSKSYESVSEWEWIQLSVGVRACEWAGGGGSVCLWGWGRVGFRVGVCVGVGAAGFQGGCVGMCVRLCVCVCYACVCVCVVCVCARVRGGGGAERVDA